MLLPAALYNTTVVDHFCLLLYRCVLVISCIVPELVSQQMICNLEGMVTPVEH